MVDLLLLGLPVDGLLCCPAPLSLLGVCPVGDSRPEELSLPGLPGSYPTPSCLPFCLLKGVSCL